MNDGGSSSSSSSSSRDGDRRAIFEAVFPEQYKNLRFQARCLEDQYRADMAAVDAILVSYKRVLAMYTRG